MERMTEEIGDRENVVRRIKKMGSLTFKGLWICRNYCRPLGIGNKTPSGKAGLS